MDDRPLVVQPAAENRHFRTSDWQILFGIPPHAEKKTQAN